MSAFSTNDTRGPNSPTASQAFFTTAMHSSQDPSIVVNIGSVRAGSPLSRTTSTAAATAGETEPSLPDVDGEIEKATNMRTVYAFGALSQRRRRLVDVPEGHVIHAIANDINDCFGGKNVRVSSPQGRFADAANLLDGTRLVSAQGVGKQLFIDFEADNCVWVHLGLIGKFRFYPLNEIGSFETLRLLITDGKIGAELRGPQWCRLITCDERDAQIVKSGPDPIRDDADPERAWKKLHRSSKTLAQVLMDQSAFAGVGNIYRAEVLFRHGVDPQVRAKDITRDVFDSIWQDLVALMREGTARRRLDTVDPEHSPKAQHRPPRVDAHGGEVYVYRRLGQPCLVCGTTVIADTVAGRNLYWCPTCQPQGSLGKVRTRFGAGCPLSEDPLAK